jgi:hypothetical protein
MQIWSNWKQFPDAQSGELIEAPVGPEDYEIRHSLTGRLGGAPPGLIFLRNAPLRPAIRRPLHLYGASDNGFQSIANSV